MAERIGFQVDRGIRLRAALRGPRLSLGPRIDRLDGRDERDEGEASHRRWAALSGGGVVPEPAPRGRRARRRKAQEWQTVHDHLVRVTTIHERPVTRAAPPVLEQRAPDPDDLRRRVLAEATAGLGPMALLARGRARRAAQEDLDGTVAERESQLREAARREQAEVRAWWEALLANDPTVVRERLRLAFDAHRFAAAVAAVGGDRVHLVVPVAKPSALVGDREPTTEPDGARTLPKMTKERRHAVYEAAIGSGLMATAAEAFAVCPGLGRVATAVVAPEHVGGPAVLLLVEVTRELVLPDGAGHAAIGSVEEVEAREHAGLGRVVIDRGDVSRALRPLEADHPDVAPVLSVLDTDITS